jgi:hypothetical protein
MERKIDVNACVWTVFLQKKLLCLFVSNQISNVECVWTLFLSQRGGSGNKEPKE